MVGPEETVQDLLRQRPQRRPKILPRFGGEDELGQAELAHPGRVPADEPARVRVRGKGDVVINPQGPAAWNRQLVSRNGGQPDGRRVEQRSLQLKGSRAPGRDRDPEPEHRHLGGRITGDNGDLPGLLEAASLLVAHVGLLEQVERGRKGSLGHVGVAQRG